MIRRAGSGVQLGSLSTGRTLHTATLLPNGKVLVAGGAGNGSGDGFFLRSAELYDPASGIWSTTGSLLTGRVFAHGDVAAQWQGAGGGRIQ